MNNNKLLTLLGFCRKAGKLMIGTQHVTDAVKAGKKALVIIANDISAKTEKELRYFAEKGKAVVERVDYSTADISQAIGIKAGVVATTDQEFCKAILQGGND